MGVGPQSAASLLQSPIVCLTLVPPKNVELARARNKNKKEKKRVTLARPAACGRKAGRWAGGWAGGLIVSHRSGLWL